MKKILLVCTSTSSVVDFRLPLIKALLKDGYSVSLIVFDEERLSEISTLPIQIKVIKANNRSTNIFETFSLTGKLKTIMKDINPDIVFTFMLKPNIFGVKAAKKARINKIFSMVEGVGDVYTRKGLKWSIIRVIVSLLYRSSFKYSKKVIFLNEDNRKEFIQRRIVKEQKTLIVPGIGVDIDKFKYKEIKNDNVILMISRLLSTKGVIEFCEAALILHKKHPEIKFWLVGPEVEIKKEELNKYISNGAVVYYGPTKNVIPYIEDCTIYVLPSYKEGMSMSIMEAESIGRPIITTRTSGCKDAIKEDYNGLLVDVKDINGLAERIEQLVLDKEMVRIFGENSRKLVEDIFDQRKINERIIGIIEDE